MLQLDSNLKSESVQKMSSNIKHKQENEADGQTTPSVDNTIANSSTEDMFAFS
jgi:hypothetical protein